MNISKVWRQVLLAAMLSFAGIASAEQQLFGVNPFNNDATSPPGSYGLFYLSANTGAITGGRVITVPTRTITGAQGLAQDPTTGTVYAIVGASGVSGRLLITINLGTGAGVEVGNLGDNFSSIAFRGDGQLFGTTGDGASVPETLYLINKADATKVIATALGNGSDGEVIAFHPPSNSFFHWSGGTIVFERILAVAPYTVTNIPITGSPTGEIFGAVWSAERQQFLVHDINSSMDFWTTTGVRSNAQPATINEVRGMVLLGSSAIPTLSEWALVLLALLMASAAYVTLRRRSGRH